ncbi:MAG: hypothetical protein JTT11_08660 [Candidatus Brockarchaeota archaeon]|nr:hypothetical protein [Candidatus Brockarchaeota archaeon]
MPGMGVEGAVITLFAYATVPHLLATALIRRPRRYGSLALAVSGAEAPGWLAAQLSKSLTPFNLSSIFASN